MLRKLLSVLLPRDEAEERARAYRDVIREGAKIGGSLFGPVPKGSRREFFCLDANTWVWHEEWTDANGMRQARTTRYDVRPQGILKAQDGQPYQRLSREEAMRLLNAATRYTELVEQRLSPSLAVA